MYFRLRLFRIKEDNEVTKSLVNTANFKVALHKFSKTRTFKRSAQILRCTYIQPKVGPLQLEKFNSGKCLRTD